MRPLFPAVCLMGLLLLGMGDDGHTASLFPGTPALNEREQQIAYQILKEIESRVGFLDNVGLGYLTLGQASPTLSGRSRRTATRMN